jgi:hypothetical protein
MPSTTSAYEKKGFVRPCGCQYSEDQLQAVNVPLTLWGPMPLQRGIRVRMCPHKVVAVWGAKSLAEGSGDSVPKGLIINPLTTVVAGGGQQPSSSKGDVRLTTMIEGTSIKEGGTSRRQVVNPLGTNAPS